MKIVIVDDEPDVCDLIHYYLSKRDIQVEKFNDPEKAWHHIKQDPPELIITDWLMPKINGEELLKLIKSDTKLEHIPVIFLSCMTDFAGISKLFRFGACDYLVKPINMSALYNKVVENYQVTYNRAFVQV